MDKQSIIVGADIIIVVVAVIVVVVVVIAVIIVASVATATVVVVVVTFDVEREGEQPLSPNVADILKLVQLTSRSYVKIDPHVSHLTNII